MLILTAIKMLFIDKDKPNEKQASKPTTEIVTEKK
jgi:hypothetical protein